MAKIYPGYTLFAATRKGNHNYFDNTKRPALNLKRVTKKGTVQYAGLFLHQDTTFEKDGDFGVIRFPIGNSPIASLLIKE